MMLRSSSTPILGSLVSSYSESPNHHNNHGSDHHFNSPKHQLPRKLSLHQTGPLHLITSSPSPRNITSSPSVNGDHSQNRGFRRVQSEGNLDGLVSDSFNSTFEDFNNHHLTSNKFSRKPHCSVLESIPASSGHNEYEDDEEEEEEEEDDGEFDESEEERENVVEGEDIVSEMSGAYGKKMSLLYGNEVEMENDEYIPTKMHLAMGLGVMSGGFNGGGGGFNGATGFGGDASDGDGASMEEYYRKMMEENPGNPLFLSNYAQFLHQCKDLGKAEEYYSRAILVDPGDGEILSKYAQLTWELYQDQDRASSYFQRAVQAAPQDSSVLAAYAGFLWETEEEEEADSDMLCSKHAIHHDGTLAAAGT